MCLEKGERHVGCEKLSEKGMKPALVWSVDGNIREALVPFVTSQEAKFVANIEVKRAQRTGSDSPYSLVASA